MANVPPQPALVTPSAAWQVGAGSLGVRVEAQDDDRTRLSCAQGTGTLRDCTTVRYRHCMDDQLTSFEVEMLECSNDQLASMAIGVVSKGSNLVSSMPGWETGDVGVHCDDGHLYQGSNVQGNTLSFFNSGMKKGDRFACSIEYLESTKKTVDGAVGLAFTKNDLPIGWTVQKTVPIGRFYPALGLLGRGAVVSVKINRASPSPAESSSPSSSNNLLSPSESSLPGSSNNLLSSPSVGATSPAKSPGPSPHLSPGRSPHLSPGPSPLHVSPTVARLLQDPQPVDWGKVNEFVSIESDGSLRYTGRGIVGRDAGHALAFKPLLATRSYFELHVLDSGKRSRIAVGLCAASSSSSSPSSPLPGWHEKSVAYHGDDGYVFFGSPDEGMPAGHKLQSGDRIGCGLLFPPPPSTGESGTFGGGGGGSQRVAQVFFALNDSVIVTPRDVEVPTGGFYPTVAMLSPGEHVGASYRPFFRDPVVAAGAELLNNVNLLSVSVDKKQTEKAIGMVFAKDDIAAAKVTTPVLEDTVPPPQPSPAIPRALWTCGERVSCTDASEGHIERREFVLSGRDLRASTAEYIHCDRILSDDGCPVFEVELKSLAVNGRMGIGVTPTRSFTPSPLLPPESVLLNTCTGIIQWSGHSQQFSAAIGVGDCISCTVRRRGDGSGMACDDRQQDLVFALNGVVIGCITADIPADKCFPFVALWRNGDAVAVSMDSRGSRPEWPAVDLIQQPIPLGARRNIAIKGCHVFSTASEEEVSLFQWDRPLTASHPYVEVEVVCSRLPSSVTLGISNGNRLGIPGKMNGSLGFCNGHIVTWPERARSGTARKVGSKSSKYSLVRHLDRLGVGLNAQGLAHRGKPTVFFTHNGYMVDSMEWDSPPSLPPLVPTVSLSHNGCVRIDDAAKWPPGAQASPPWQRLEKLRLNQDLLCYTHRGEGDADVGSAASAAALSPSLPYFELEIVDPGRGCYVGIGAACSNGGPYHGMIGWEEGSVGYHADDGSVFESEGKGHAFGPLCQQGDFMGCGVEFEPVTNDGVARPRRLFFTRNHQIVGHTACPVAVSRLVPGVTSRSTFHAMISLHSEGAVVRPHLGLEWPQRQDSLGVGAARGSLLRYSPQSDTYLYTGERVENLDTGVVQAAEPLTKQTPYFEVTVADTGKDGGIGVGVAADNYALSHQPGWLQESVALHVDDGKLFVHGLHKTCCSPSVQGDVIGCGVLFHKSTTSKPELLAKKADSRRTVSSAVRPNANVFFTRNGKAVGNVDVKLPEYGFFPTVGLHTPGAEVKINWKAAYPQICSLGKQWQQSVRIQSDDGVQSDDGDGNGDDAGKVLCYTGRSASQKDAGIAVARHPLEQERSFFAVTLLAEGARGGSVTVGLVNENFTDNMLRPGEAESSIGFHASSGGLFVPGQPSRLCSKPCRVNDVVGCGVDLSLSVAPGRLQSAKASSHVYFTLNGKIVSRARVPCAPHLLYPAVSLHGVGDRVRVDLESPPSLARAKHRAIGWARSHEVQLHGSMVRHVSASSSLSGTVMHRKTSTFGVAQGVLFDATGHEQYFEAILMSAGKSCNVCLGYAPLDMSVSQQPGTSPGSVMFSLSKGAVYNGNDTPKICSGQTYNSGDSFGCYIAWPGSKAGSSSWLPAGSAQVVFLCNREEIARCMAVIPEGLDPCDLLPTVTLCGKDEEVFLSVADAQVPAATRTSDRLQSANIRVDDHGCFIVKPYLEQSGFLQLCEPLTADSPTFRVKCFAETSGVYVGIAPALFPLSQQMGHAMGSVGCEMEGGMIICEGHHVADCPPFVEGDILGLTVDFSESSMLGGTPYHAVAVSRNGTVVGRTTIGVRKGTHVHPALVLTGDKAAVKRLVAADGDGECPVPRPTSFASLGWIQFKRVSVSSYGHCLRYGGGGDGPHDCGVAIAAAALSPKCNYFEATICSGGRDGAIAVGLVHPEYRCDHMPGWLPLSVAYHADDGGIFTGMGKTDRFAAPSRRMDVIGCGINFSARTQPGKIEVFFTRNQHVMATESLAVPPTGLFPAVGLMSPGERVFVDVVPWQGGQKSLNVVVNDTAS